MNLTHRHTVPTFAWSVTALDATAWPQRSGAAADTRAAWSDLVSAAEDLLTEHHLPDVRLVIAGDLVGTYAPGRDAAGRPDPVAVRAGLRDLQAAADPDADQPDLARLTTTARAGLRADVVVPCPPFTTTFN